MAAQLLSLALSLLIAAQAPNVPQDVKDRAIALAHTAITYALAPQDTSPAGSAAPPVAANPEKTVSFVEKRDECVVFAVSDSLGMRVPGYEIAARGMFFRNHEKTDRTEYQFVTRRTDARGEITDCRQIDEWHFDGENLRTSNQPIESAHWIQTVCGGTPPEGSWWWSPALCYQKVDGPQRTQSSYY